MDKFRNKYRIPSTRLQNWDYGWNAAYFITICTANRECFFGDIVETQNLASLRLRLREQSSSPTEPPKNKFGPQSQNLASIIRGI